jgi:chromatin modification-related protein VID21
LRVDERATAPLENGVREKTTPMIILEGSNSKGSQAHLPNGPPPIAGEAGNEPTGHTVESQSQLTGGAPPENVLESERIRKVVESRPNSPGVDPRKASPVSTEDTANLFNTPIDGPGSADTDHKAKTIHLPPKEVQEERIRLQKAEETQNPGRYRRETKHGRLGLQLPPHDTQHEPMSSPGSTNGAQSATTPALHDTSTDTSPDNEGSRYDVEGGERDQDDGTRTPVKLPPARDFVDKDDNDSILKAQIQSTQTEVPGSSPSAANDQLRMEEQAASLSTVIQDGNDMGTTDQQAATTMEDDGQTVNYLSKEATEVVQEAVQIQDSLTNEATKVVQEVVQDVVPEPTSNARDVEVSGGQPCAELSVTMATEVPDSDNDGRTLVDAMEVDATTTKDSFDSDTANNQIKNPSAVPGGVDSDSENLANQKRSSITSTSATVCRTSSTASAAPPVLERMTTRISSNTIRHKSVAEIIGEIPRPTSADRSSKINVNTGSSGTPSSPSRSSTPQSPGTRMRSLVEKAKERERSKLSTVTFQKRTNKSSSNDTALMPTGSQRAKPQEDYLKPLFIASATNDKRGIPALDSLLATAHKTITTANAYVTIHESQTNKILKRIYQLQNMNKWSLRQPKRAVEPNRPTTHWDVLLQEAKWMRTDFREERKWKSAAARNLAFACAEWVESNLEDRKLLQVKTVPPRFLSSEKDTEMSGMSSQEVPHSTPELVASEGIDSPMDDLDEEPRLDLMETVAPTAIFTLQDDDVVFGLRDSPTARKLLAELPMYGAPLRVPQSDILTSEIDPDRLWRRPALPLSKYVEGRMELKFDGPPRKKSRYEYDDEDEDDDEVVFGEQGQKKPVLPPETTDVALFDPQHKHIRDRIHSSHQFRPPSEFPMPLQSFFETRTPSQWTWDEDNELKALVRECTYNWSLISSMLTSKSLFAAGNERRTPWECFERWVQMEGLPNDMQKTHYFRAYMSRIEAANRNVVAQAAAAQAASMANGQAQPPPRRRATTSIRVDQRRKQKHLTLVDAMRKLAKKRETSIQKQQQAAGMAAMRKANENQQPAQPRNLHTPQEFSRLKHDRDEQFKERLLQLQQRQEAQRRVRFH